MGVQHHEEIFLDHERILVRRTSRDIHITEHDHCQYYRLVELGCIYQHQCHSHTEGIEKCLLLHHTRPASFDDIGMLEVHWPPEAAIIVLLESKSSHDEWIHLQSSILL